MSTVAVAPALVGLVACAAGGALTPYVVRRLPEPAPPADPDPADHDDADAVAPTPLEQAILDEPPKEPFAELGAHAWFAPVAAAVAGVSGALVGAAVGWHWLLVLLWPLCVVGALLGIVDARTRLLPKVVVLPATGAALVAGGVHWAVTGEPDTFVRGLVAMIVVRSVFWALWFVRQAGMGFGDVRLSALLGLVLGYAGRDVVMAGVYAAFIGFVVLVAVPALVLSLARHDRSLMRKGFPFGPFLLGGALVAVVAGGFGWL